MSRPTAVQPALHILPTGQKASYGSIAPSQGTQRPPTRGKHRVAGIGQPSRCSTARITSAVPGGSLILNFFLALLAALLLWAGPAAAATPGGTRISNTASITIGAGAGRIFSNTVTVMVRSAASIELLKYAPTLNSAERIAVSATTYQAVNGTFQPIAVPAEIATQPVPLHEGQPFHGGETIYLRLTDPDQNHDPTLTETVLVKVTCHATGDLEVLRLKETAADSGVFTGYLPSAGSGSVQSNGLLLLASDSEIFASYTDVSDGTDVAVATAVVDPLGIVFDSLTGTPLDGAEITLIDATTGKPAVVFGDDGVSGFPATVTSGGVLVDGGGTVYRFPAGGFRFPFITPGNYRLQVLPPAGYTVPSSASDTDLQALPGAPFALVGGSRGEAFSVNPGPAVQIDIPADPQESALWLNKEVDRDQVTVGDFLQYHLTLENTAVLGMATAVRISDRLPLGFRYQRGSARLNGSKVSDPVISADGRQLSFAIDNLPPGGRVGLRYVVEVAAGTSIGEAVNRAQATDSAGRHSNLAQATVRVKEAFFRDSTFLLGRVLAGNCADVEETMLGMEGVRIYLEDGTYVVTDDAGRFHFEGVAAGVHVVQLDLATLPSGYQVLDCQTDSRFAGRFFSQFVDLQGGTLWQTNFYVGQSPIAGERVNASQEVLVASELADTSRMPTSMPKVPTGIAAIPENPLGNDDAKSAIAAGIKAPLNGTRLAERFSQVQVFIDSRLTPRLMLDGQHVFEERIGFTRKDPHTGLTAYNYVGIDFGSPGQHELVLQGLDPFGNVRYQAASMVTRTGEVKRIVQLPGPDNLADGVSPVIVLLRIEDHAREPVGATVNMQLTGGTLAPFREKQESLRTPADPDAGQVVVAPDGTVMFAPVTQAGRHTATLRYDDIEVDVEIWLKPVPRDWVLVGFAAGTVGYNTISDNQVNAEEAGIDEHGYTDGQVRFFAKGAIKGEWLLTLAYDSDKPDLDGDSLQQIIDPNTYYPLYGDETQQGYEAASAENLYVKLERDQFYALFGDMQTDLTQTVLSEYSRTMNGFKSELNTEHFAYTVFAAETKQAFKKDEIRGDGTAGRYKISQSHLVINSETVIIETRDRFHNELIVKEEPLSRYLDYDIDYDAGTLYFKRPVPSKDENFNPVFIVVRYETLASSEKNWNYGGRAAVKLFDQKLEVGGSLIHEENGAEDGNLFGTDVTVRLTPQTTIHAEIATSGIDHIDGDDRNGDAYLAEVEHLGANFDLRAWFRQQDGEFGLGQQNGDTVGMRTYGTLGSYRLNPQWRLTGEIYHEDNLGSDAERDVASLQGEYRADRYSLTAGVREARDRFDDGVKQTSRQMLLGGNWTTPDRKLTLRTAHEQSLGGNDENLDYPTRTMIGADYQLTRSVSLFVEQEFTWGEKEDTEGTRLGLKAMPWQGGEVRTAVERENIENNERIFALFGVGQTWQVTSAWSVDLSIDRTQTIKNEPVGERINPGSAPASGHDYPNRAYRGNNDDFTAVSLGTAYRAEDWSWWNRVEVRQGDSEDKFGVSSGLVKQLRQGLAASARLLAYVTNQDGTKRDEEDLRLGLAYRPDHGRWIVLERLDLERDQARDAAGGEQTGWRVVNHLHASFRADRLWQTSFYYGCKYAREDFDQDRYDGFTDMLAVETRYALNQRWDLGASGAALHSWNSGQTDYSAGASVGFQFVTNSWVSIGYNMAGFEDNDFSAANYTAQGPYVRFRVKFDQQSVKDIVEWFTR